MNKNQGFTIIELLITITVIGILSAVVLLYSRRSGKIVDLNRGVYNIVDNFSQVRSNSLGAKFFSEDKKVCGWGVHIPEVPTNAYYIFIDLVDNSQSCRNSDLIFSGDSSGERVKAVFLEKGALITAKSFSDILFIPPNPDVAIDGVTTTESGTITIEAGNYKRDVTISRFGQITYSEAR